MKQAQKRLGSFGEGGIKERVKNVLNFKKPPRVIIIAAVAFVVILSVGLAVNRINSDNQNSRENEDGISYPAGPYGEFYKHRTGFTSDTEGWFAGSTDVAAGWQETYVGSPEKTPYISHANVVAANPRKEHRF